MSDFNFINIIEGCEYTSNRFNRDYVVAGIKKYFERNPGSLEKLNKAYDKQDKKGIIRQLEECLRSIRAGDDVKYRTYQAINHILRNSFDSLLNKLTITGAPPVNKLNRQEMLLKDLLDGGIDVEELADRYCVDERSIRNDVKQLNSGQGLVQEYLNYLPDTGEMLGINVEIKKDQVISLSKVHPIKLLLTEKETYYLLKALSSAINKDGEASEPLRRVMGEIMRDAAGTMMDVMEKVGLEPEATDLENRIAVLKDVFALVDGHQDFNWSRYFVSLEYFEGHSLVKSEGRIKKIKGDYLIFIKKDQGEKQVPIADIIEITKKE